MFLLVVVGEEFVDNLLMTDSADGSEEFVHIQGLKLRLEENFGPRISLLQKELARTYNVELRRMSARRGCHKDMMRSCLMISRRICSRVTGFVVSRWEFMSLYF